MAEATNETPDTVSKWAILKDRLGIASAIVVLVFLGYFMFEGSVMNFQCSFTEFLTFKCNRYDAHPKSWDEIKYRE